MNKLKQILKSFKESWMIMNSKCPCGGVIIDYSDKLAWCDDCGINY